MNAYRSFCFACMLAVSAVVSACGGGGGSDPVQLPFSVIDRDAFSGVRTQRFTVSRNAAEWEALWAEHKTVLPPQPAPAVDFSREMVIGVFMGARSSGCNTVLITSVTQAFGRITVVYWEPPPPPTALCAAVITYPSQLATVASSSLPVEFVAAN